MEETLEGLRADNESLAQELWRMKDLVARYQDALIWCSGSADFGPGGQAEEGWNKVCRPLPGDAERAFLESVMEEVQRSRAKYPERGIHRFVAFAGEAGEVLQAWAKHLIYRSRESWDHLQLELRQAAAMAVRFSVEGDRDAPNPSAQGGIKHISQCVPDHLLGTPIDHLHRELEEYKALGTAKGLRECIAKRDSLLRFVGENLALMELNTQLTRDEMQKRHEAEARLEEALETLQEVVVMFNQTLPTEKGDSKAHLLWHRATKTITYARRKGLLGDARMRRERDEILAAAGWLAHVVLEDKHGSSTHDAWISQGKRFYRDAINTVDRHQHLFDIAKAALEKQAYGCQDTCPECGGTKEQHEPKCALHATILALEQATLGIPN